MQYYTLTCLDFITTPSTATVVVGFPGYNDTVYLGQFQCVTRVGFRLVWVINGLSADNIRSTPGFEDVSYELIPIQDTGNTLSILNIPASTGINGTIVTCTAVYNRSIEAHSLPVYLIVTQGQLIARACTYTMISYSEYQVLLSTQECLSHCCAIS